MRGSVTALYSPTEDCISVAALAWSYHKAAAPSVGEGMEYGMHGACMTGITACNAAFQGLKSPPGDAKMSRWDP